MYMSYLNEKRNKNLKKERKGHVCSSVWWTRKFITDKRASIARGGGIWVNPEWT